MQKHVPDHRRVALIRSRASGNRFYVLIEPERGIRDGDSVDLTSEDLLLGIACPCLEEGLNDFAVIRTTFETLDLFPADDPIRDEMMEIVLDAKRDLLGRLCELRDKIRDKVAHFLGTNYNEFKEFFVALVDQGYPRGNFNSMMKLDVFSSVAEAEGHSDADEPLYYFEFNYTDVEQIRRLPAHRFIAAVFDELISSIQEGANYKGKRPFDKKVFQKFVALLFVSYSATDPMFYGINSRYGINRRDYGLKKDDSVPADENAEETPLYRAIARQLREIEAEFR